jgi:FkbM family methyltransferase
LMPEKWKRYIKAELFQVHETESSLRGMKPQGFSPAVAVDMGAFVGDWTRSFRRIFRDSRVLMIEPQASKTAILTKIAISLRNVELRPALLGAKAEANVGFCESETAGSVLPESENKRPPTTYLPMTTLDAITEGSPFADLQGYEIEVLRGGRTLASAEAVLMEVNLLGLLIP